MMDLEQFRETLKRHRNARRWSQERLAFEAGCDHSLVSRTENGQRTPTRDFISKIATGLALTPHQRDEMLILAGHTPENPASILASDPEMAALYEVLHDEDVPDHVKAHMRSMLRGLVALGGRERALRAVA